MQNWPKSAAILAILIVAIGSIVLLAVFVGWWLIFKPVLPRPWLAAAPALFLAAFALLLARLLAEKFAEAKAPSAPPMKRRFYLLYLFLFAVSAMGTVNAAFVLWEGSSVVRQDMAEVRGAYTALDVAARQRLLLPEQESKRSRLEALLTNLEQEINNPNGGNLCGVGEAANAIVGRIREIVPQMPVIRGTGAIRSCDPARGRKVAEAYAQSARASLEQDPDYLRFRGPEKTGFLRDLEGHVAAMRRAFEQVEGVLGDPTAFARAEVQRPLATAAADYNADYRRLAGLGAPPSGDVPARVDVSQSQELGSFAAFFDILGSRLTSLKTWVYLLVALLLDLSLVHFLTEAFRRYRHVQGRSPIDALSPERRPSEIPVGESAGRRLPNGDQACLANPLSIRDRCCRASPLSRASSASRGECIGTRARRCPAASGSRRTSATR